MVMADVNKTGDETTANYDAEQFVEEISAGEEKAPKVNVEADYERSKQFDVADIDRTDEGAKAADKAMASQFPASQSSAAGEGAATGNPDDFRAMAKEVKKPLDA
jgi:hypothetical protein